MKRTLFFMLLSVYLSAPAAWAYDFEADGIYYNILSSDDKTVAVTYRSYSFGYSSDYSGDVTIPATVTHNGTEYRVTSIGSSAFSGCTDLTEITIPNSVTSIGYGAFSGCTGLKNLRIEDGTKTLSLGTSYSATPFDNCPLDKVYLGRNIDYSYEQYNIRHDDDSPFRNKESLVSLTIGNQVTAIGKSAFSGCTGMTEITIPNSVTTIDEKAFSGCTNLKNLKIEDGTKTLGLSTLSYSTPFDDCPLDTVYLGRNISYGRYDSPFENNKHLVSLTIGNQVTSIGRSAFDGCSYLHEVTIPNSVTAIDERAFSGCSSLKTVTIPNSVTTIGDRAFWDCDGLTEITIPESVTSIGKCAFEFCDGLTSVTIPESVTSIDDGAFSYCTGLKEIYFNAKNCRATISWNGSKFSDLKNDVELHIGKNVKYIPTIATKFSVSTYLTVYFNADSCVSGCFNNEALRSVHIGENVRYIPSCAFSGCTALRIYISDLTAWWHIKFMGSDTNPLDYARFLYVDSTELQDLTIPDDITAIDTRFQNCRSLTSVTIPESVTTISSGAFYGCTNLRRFEGKWASSDQRYLIMEEKTESDTVKVLHSFAPYSYSKFSYTIPDSITRIGEYAFGSCTGLRSITIPKSVTTIDSYAFSGCTGLQTIIPLGTIPPSISSNTFDNDTYKKATVNYPKGSLLTYKNNYNWGKFNYPTAQELLNPQLTCDSVGETKYHCTVSYTHDVDYPVSKLSFQIDEKEYALDTALTTLPVTIIDLEPETEYDAQFIIETIYGDQVVTPVTFTTDTVHLTTQPAKTTDVKATLEAVVKCDAETGYGFEWRRYGAPDNLPPTRVEAYNIDGKIAGTLRNLTPEAYYEYRPYYRTVSGKYYYDEWVAFGTFDYGVEWDPTVSTRAGEVEGNNSTISAYVVEGSDELLSQGFEYWAETPVTRSTESIATRSTASEPERIEGSGTLMSVTLTGLDYNTTYYYRAYATTAKKTTYGNTESFTTGKAPVVQDFKPTGITPTDNSEVEALKTFTLEFEETPSLAVKAQTITLAGNDTLLTATLSAGSGNTLAITLADTLKTAGEYTLTIPEGTFGDADFADDPTVGHCNPELVYTYTIKEPEPVEPDEPENPDKPDEPIVPDEPSSITETQADAEHITVYNLQGVLVLETDDAADLKTLQNGAYIVNGKKMIIAR